MRVIAKEDIDKAVVDMGLALSSIKMEDIPGQLLGATYPEAQLAILFLLRELARLQLRVSELEEGVA